MKIFMRYTLVLLFMVGGTLQSMEPQDIELTDLAEEIESSEPETIEEIILSPSPEYWLALLPQELRESIAKKVIDYKQFSSDVMYWIIKNLFDKDRLKLKRLATFPYHVDNVSFTADSKFTLIQADNSSALYQIDGWRNKIIAGDRLVLSPDGRFAIAYHMNKQADIYDTYTWQMIKKFNEVNKIYISSLGTYAVVFFNDGKKSVFKRAGWIKIKDLHDDITSVAFSSQDRFMIGKTDANGKQLYRTADWQLQKLFEDKSIKDVIFSPQDTYATIFFSNDETGAIYTTDNWARLPVQFKIRKPVYFTPDEEHFVAQIQDTVYIFSIRDLVYPRNTLAQGYLASIMFGGDSLYALAQFEDNHAELIWINEWKVLKKYDRVYNAWLSSDGQYMRLLTGSGEYSQIWELNFRTIQKMVSLLSTDQARLINSVYLKKSNKNPIELQEKEKILFSSLPEDIQIILKPYLKKSDQFLGKRGEDLKARLKKIFK